MGRRSGTETIVAILACFVRKRSWSQAELAREVGVSVKSLRARLDELSTHGIRVSRYAESQRDVRWDVPSDWFPDARGLSDVEADQCMRLLARLPASKARDTMLARLAGRAAAQKAREADQNDGLLEALEDAARARVPVRILYDSASSELGFRTVSVHRIVYEAPVRFVATSHERDRLAWYRVERVRRVESAEGERRIEVDPAVVDAYVEESADGFHRGKTVRCSFVVRDPEARWVVENLPVQGATVRRVSLGAAGGGDGGEAEREELRGAEVVVDTAGVEVLARFVVGLGGAARPTSEELAARVRAIAVGALGGEAAAAAVAGAERITRRTRALAAALGGEARFEQAPEPEPRPSRIAPGRQGKLSRTRTPARGAES